MEVITDHAIGERVVSVALGLEVKHVVISDARDQSASMTRASPASRGS
jgi:hypothetical protein